MLCSLTVCAFHCMERSSSICPSTPHVHCTMLYSTCSYMYLFIYVFFKLNNRKKKSCCRHYIFLLYTLSIYMKMLKYLYIDLIYRFCTLWCTDFYAKKTSRSNENYYKLHFIIYKSCFFRLEFSIRIRIDDTLFFIRQISKSTY